MRSNQVAQLCLMPYLVRPFMEQSSDGAVIGTMHTDAHTHTHTHTHTHQASKNINKHQHTHTHGDVAGTMRARTHTHTVTHPHTTRINTTQQASTHITRLKKHQQASTTPECFHCGSGANVTMCGECANPLCYKCRWQRPDKGGLHSCPGCAPESARQVRNPRQLAKKAKDVGGATRTHTHNCTRTCAHAHTC